MGFDITSPTAAAPEIGVLAEDLYGALAVAARLQQRGVTVQVERGPRRDPVRAQAVVVDMQAHRAADVVSQAGEWASWLRTVGCRRIEQRVEPTLRGNPADCLRGTLTGAGYADPVVIASTAYPSAGSMCIDGRQVLPTAVDHELSVERILFGGADAGHVDLATIARGVAVTAEAVDEQLRRGIRRIVLDAASEDDLRVGSAVTEQLRESGHDVLTCTSGAWLRYYPDLGTDGFVIVAVSSRNDLGDRQLRQVATSFAEEGLVLTSDEILDSSEAHLVKLCGKHRVIALQTTWRYGADLHRPSRRTAEAVRQLLDASLDARNPCLGVVVSGGLTAAAVIDRLDYNQLRPGNELEPLCPVLRIGGGPFDGMAVISKGSFVGSDNTLVRLIRRIIGT